MEGATLGELTLPPCLAWSLPAFEERKKVSEMRTWGSSCWHPNWGTFIVFELPSLLSLFILKNSKFGTALRSWFFNLHGMQMPGDNESKRAASTVLQAQLCSTVSPPCQHWSFGIPSLPMFLCQEKQPTTWSAEERNAQGSGSPNCQQDSLCPMGGQKGDLEIIWGFQERTFSRHSAMLGKHSPSGVSVQEPHTRCPPAPQIAGRYRKFHSPISKTERPFPQR